MLHENTVVLGDCLDVLRQLPDCSVDSVVTDPPYGLGTKEPSIEEIIAYLQGADLDTGGDFMGKKWSVPSVAVWKECYRVLKPGGHLLSFGGTRTFDLISLGLRAAGFQNRDTISSDFGCPVLSWRHGMGFPKSLNVGKAIDKQAGVEREVIGTYRVGGNALTSTKEKGGTFVTGAPNSPSGDLSITAPATEDAKKWDGWGTAMKPSWEPVLMFRKPPQESTVVDNVLKHGTGAINIDGCRVAGQAETPGSMRSYRRFDDKGDEPDLVEPPAAHPGGRWPPNALMVHSEGCKRVGTKRVKAHQLGNKNPTPTLGETYEGGDFASRSLVDHADQDGNETVEAWECTEGCPVRALDEQSGISKNGGNVYQGNGPGGFSGNIGGKPTDYAGDSGGASRFFPQFEGQVPPEAPFMYTGKATKKEATLDGQVPNKHPTKKPLKLMQWLVRLVTPKGGICLDPFCGSGTTCVAAIEEGMRFIGIERDPSYHADTVKRVGMVYDKEEVYREQEDALEELFNG